MTTRSLATGAISPSATALGTAFAVSCLLHVAALGASLIVPWPIYVPPAVAVLPVELVETASDVTQAPSVVPAPAPVARRDMAPVARRAVPVHRPLPAPPESVSESRDTDRAEPAPAEQVVQAAQPAEAAAVRAAPGAAPAFAPPVGGTSSTVTSVAAFAESAGDMAASLTQSTRTPQSSGSAAATGPVAAIQPNSVAAPRITQAARPSGGYQVRPTYPPAARRAGAEGTTLLRVHVLDDGRIGQVQVERSAGHVALDQAAAEAVRKWHFEPARSGSETVAVWVLIPVEFRLRSGL